MTTAAFPARIARRRRTEGSAAIRVAAYLVLLDLLILPYFPLFIMPLSLGFMIAWAVCRFEIGVDSDLRLFFVIATCVVASAGLSTLYREQPQIIENLKRAGQLLTTFAYYFFFRRAARDRRFDPTPVMLLFMAYHTAWALYFSASPEAALAGVQRVYSSSAWVGDMNEANLLFLRFPYFFPDPNTAGYFVAMIGLFLLTYGGLGSIATAAVVGMLAIGIVATGSRGAVLAVAVATLIVGWRRGAFGRHVVKFAIVAAVFATAAFFAYRWYAERHPDRALTVNKVYETVATRIVGRPDQSFADVLFRGEESAGESRLAKYKWAVTSLWPLPLGRGNEILDGPPSFRPHSDVLRFLYSYGFIALVAAWLFFFRDVWRHEFAYPALMAFAVNTLIDEQKLLAVFMILLASARVRAEQARIQRHAS